MTTSFEMVPKGSVLSYQSLEYEKLDKSKQTAYSRSIGISSIRYAGKQSLCIWNK